MNNWIKTSAFAIALLTCSFLPAQDDKHKTEKKQEIIIRKNGDAKEKMTIVVDGDNITVNGKPLSEYKNDELTVIRRDRSDMLGAARPRLATTLRGDAQLFDDWNNKALLGVTTEKSDDGAKVNVISKESGADKAGIKEGDVITKVGDKKITDGDDLVAAINNYKPKDKVDITYKRAGKETKTTATLGENKFRSFSLNNNFDLNMPELKGLPGQAFGYNFGKPKIGLQIQDLEEGKGVTVKEVDEESPAFKAGIKEGDIITSVNGKEIAGVDELRTEIKDVKEGEVIKFNYKRNGSAQSAEVKLPKKMKTADL